MTSSRSDKTKLKGRKTKCLYRGQNKAGNIKMATKTRGHSWTKQSWEPQNDNKDQVIHHTGVIKQTRITEKKARKKLR